MAILSENMVFSKTRTQDLRNVKQLNCWGSELTDVAIVRQMPNVVVLSLSVNNITSLVDFGTCKNLQELYLRENKIKDLNQVVHLQELSNLKKLWLAGNPCAEQANYRLTVIKALPNLEMLDNVTVSPEEISRAEESGFDLNAPGSCTSPERRNSSPPTQQLQRLSHNGAASVHEYKGDDDDEDDSEAYDDQGSGNSDNYVKQCGGNVQVSASQLNYSHGGNALDSPRLPASPQLTNNSHHSTQQGHGSHRLSQQRLSYPEMGAQQWNGSQSPAATQQTRPPPAHLTGLPTPTGAPMVRSASINDYNMFNGNNTSQPMMNPATHATNGVHHDSYYKAESTASATVTNGSKHAYPRLLPKGGKNRVRLECSFIIL